MKRIILSIVLMNFIGTTEAQNIIIAKQGHFSVGGVTIQREGEYDNRKFVGWVEQEETGQSYRADMPSWIFRYPPTLIGCRWSMYMVTAVRASAGR